jgi:hypothetical protein
MSYVYGQYGQAAVNAARQLLADPKASPRASWDAAIAELTTSAVSQGKHGPRAAFLGLCRHGYVKGAPPETASAPDKNGAYAITACRILRANPSFADLPVTMVWEIVLRAVKQNTDKAHNAQMHVVLALWHNGLL